MQINKDYIFNKVTFTSKEDAFEKLGEILNKDNVVKPGFVNALNEREENYPTGLPVEIGVAIPHTDGTLVNEDQIIFASLEKPVEFNEMGGDEEDLVDIYIIIMLAIGNGKKHLEILTKLINTIQDKNFIKQLYDAKNKDEMYTLLNENIAI